MRRAREPIVGHLLAAEVALALVTCSIVYAFTKLFSGDDFARSLLLVGALAHVTAAVARRRGLGVPASLVATVVGFTLLGTWLWFPGTAVLGVVPGPETLDAARASLDAAWTTFQEVTAPVPAQDGFLIAAGGALVLGIALADWAAFRLWSPLEALIPSLTLFIFAVVLGAPGDQVPIAAAYAAAAVAFLLTTQLARLGQASGVLRTPGRRGVGWLARPGALLGVAAVLAGVLLGPGLPGAGEPAFFDLTDQGESPGNRVVVSPLVEINERLVQQSDLVAFTVRSPEPAYWRLTSLDTFDGTIWRSGGSYDEAEGTLPRPPTDAVSAVQLDQRFSIEALSTLWLPAAYRPAAIDTGEATVRYQEQSSTVIVDTDTETSDALAYRVVSEVPKPTAEQLERPPEEVPDELDDQLQLPESFSPEVAALAQQIVERAGAETPYRQSLALQDFFRDAGAFADDGYEFTYVLGTSMAGHSTNALEEFLESGEGYCEQFAGAYAAMARSIGLPARVAVGFTWGDQDPEDPNLYRVRGRNAHAWPEVWLGDDVGWIAFEPTPSRGAPGMEAYAGVDPTQASADAGPPGSGEESATEPPPPPAEDVPANEEAGPVAPAEDLPALEEPLLLEPGEGEPGWERHLPGIGLVLLVGALAYLVAVPAAQLVRRQRRRALAGDDPAARVALAWQRSEDELATAGALRHPQETHAEFAERAADELPGQAAIVAALARTAEAAAYAPGAVSAAAVDRAEGAARAIVRSLHEATPWSRRVLAWLDPRSLTRRG